MALHSIELITWEPVNLFSHQLKTNNLPHFKISNKVGTDALVCPPECNQQEPLQVPLREKMLPEEMTRKGKLADRRGRLSLLVALHSIEITA